jgi:hypothetical protein
VAIVHEDVESIKTRLTVQGWPAEPDARRHGRPAWRSGRIAGRVDRLESRMGRVEPQLDLRDTE